MTQTNQEYKELLIKKSYGFFLNIIEFIDSLDKKDFSVQVISRQVLRSATSVGANIVEAQASSSRKDFTNFLNHSLKSANETKYWLGLLGDSGKASGTKTKSLIEQVSELSKMLGSSIVSLRRKT